jgi:hypothetical protein
MKYRILLLRLHFGLLVFVILNFILGQLTGFSIASFLLLTIKYIFYISGLLLFFLTIKPFEKKAIYFSIYILSPLGVVLAWLVDGIFGAVMASLFMWTISVDDFVVKNDNYKISQPFAGFMSACCKYSVKKNYYYLIEKKLGNFSFNEYDLSSAKFTVDENKHIVYLHYQFDQVNNKRQIADTILFLK